LFASSAEIISFIDITLRYVIAATPHSCRAVTPPFIAAAAILPLRRYATPHHAAIIAAAISYAIDNITPLILAS